MSASPRSIKRENKKGKKNVININWTLEKREKNKQGGNGTAQKILPGRNGTSRTNAKKLNQIMSWLKGSS